MHPDTLEKAFLLYVSEKYLVVKWQFAWIVVLIVILPEKSQHFSILDSKKILFKMLSNTSQVLRLASNVARIVVQRNLATSYVAANKAATDPVQGMC